MRVTPLTVSESAGGGLQMENIGGVAGLMDIVKEIGWEL
jgi:hypothetical protein